MTAEETLQYWIDGGTDLFLPEVMLGVKRAKESNPALALAALEHLRSLETDFEKWGVYAYYLVKVYLGETRGLCWGPVPAVAVPEIQHIKAVAEEQNKRWPRPQSWWTLPNYMDPLFWLLEEFKWLGIE